MKNLFVRSMLAPALLLGALSGCEGLLSDGDEVQREQFAIATARWDAANVGSYSYVITLVCDCGTVTELRPVRVTVQNGTVVSRVYESENAAERTPAPAAIFGPYDTVEELFAAVETAIDGDSDVLNVVYHPQYGAPTLLQWDPSGGGSGDHLIFQVAGLAPTTTAAP
jgi:Family of unknown function (DUF6174)